MTPLSDSFPISIKTLPFLEPILADELTSIGAIHIQLGKRIVHCTGDWEILYKANYQLRTALKVLVPIHAFSIHHSDELYRRAIKIDWQQYLHPQQTFAIDPNVHSSLFRHPHFASLRLKDAIADHFHRQLGYRPNVNTTDPNVQFHLHIDENRVTIALDSSGASLNQRGYRFSGGEAPLNEVLAAGMILLSGWKGETDFYDPMCGSGTLPIEAYFIAKNIPPQIHREKFGFQKWKNYQPDLWKKIQADSQANSCNLSVKIHASDKDFAQLNRAKKNICHAGAEKEIIPSLTPFHELHPSSEHPFLMFNPPYGERMENEDIIHSYKKTGDLLKKNWTGATAWLISSHIEAMKYIGLKPSRKINLMNGPLACKFYRYDLYRGSKSSHPYHATHPSDHLKNQSLIKD